MVGNQYEPHAACVVHVGSPKICYRIEALDPDFDNCRVTTSGLIFANLGLIIF